MFAHVEGIIAEKGKDSMVIDVQGVGFLLSTSTTTLSNTPRVGDRCRLYTIMNVREDAIELFGFFDTEEKKMFERLRGVPGIGARTALQILSAMSARDLSLAIVSGDFGALLRVPGIGKKTAQRMITELRDKIDDADLTASVTVTVRDPAAGNAQSDAIAALLALGYSSSEAARAVSSVASESEDPNQLIYLALNRLGGG